MNTCKSHGQLLIKCKQDSLTFEVFDIPNKKCQGEPQKQTAFVDKINLREVFF